MFKDQIPVSLIPSGSHSLDTDIYERLIRLGYKDISTCSSLNELYGCNTPLPQQVVVFPYVKDTHLQKQRENICKRVKQNSVLGITKAPDFNMEEQYLNICNDVIYWPCSESEFAYRMQRICDVMKHSEFVSCDDDAPENFRHMNMIGRSPSFLNVLNSINRIKCYDVPVLIEGETGTGKELAARAIHYLGPRRDLPFIPVNCGAIPETLVENELFGHKKGAYTDAKRSQEGVIGLADNGTIFLDEVEAFSQKGQVVLLRFLEGQEYKPLGASRFCRANVRIIAASNEKLSGLVEQGLFRQDLFYRLNIVRIEMPSLSRRGDDIELLTDHFLDKFKLLYNQHDKYLHPDALQWLKRYNWPGNVRELENYLHREFLLADGPCITLDHIGSICQDRRKSNMDRRKEHYLEKNMKEAKSEIIRRFEIQYLTRLLNETNGNVSKAARRAGKERRCFGKLIKKHGIENKLLDCR